MSGTKLRMSKQAFFDDNVDVNGKKLTNLGTPTLDADAATKLYVDSILDALNGFQNKGSIDCSGNPNYPAASNGHVYIVSVGGKIGGASGDSVVVGDLILCKVDDSATGDKAAVGTNWDIIHSSGASGTVTSSSSGVSDNSIVRMDSTSGQLIQTSNVTIDDSGSINIPSGQSFKKNGVALNQDDIGDGSTYKQYSATEKTKLAGIDTGALNATSIMAKRITRETPSGTLNGSNTSFTLANTPVSGTEMLFVNGVLMNAGAGNDYTISGATITMAVAPVSTDVLLCTYWK